VAGVPLLTSGLSALAGAGLRRATVVVGHHHEVIWRRYGDAFAGMALRYAHNPRYLTTSNLVSLWLARDAMDDDIILLEGDLRFEPRLIATLLADPRPDVAVVDALREGMDGTVILPRSGGCAGSLVLGRHRGPDFDGLRALKTVNIYKLSARTLRQQVLPRIEAHLGDDHTGNYYESVFGELIAEGRLHLGLLRAEGRWVEIDDAWDWHRAEATFASPSAFHAQHHDRRRPGVGRRAVADMDMVG
jgi:choline kinase